MRNRILALILAALMLTAMLTGCGGKEEPKAQTPSVSTQTQTQTQQPQPQPQVQATYTVNAYVDGWSDVRIWAWSNTQGDLFTAWPGDKMYGDGSGWYSYDIPTWVDYVIINGNGGTVQTPDLAVSPQNLWILTLDDGSASITYKDPAIFDDPWAGCEMICHDGSFIIDPYTEPVEDDSGYIAELEGEWESVHLKDGSFSMNVHALCFSETIYNCTGLTVNMQVEMKAGTSCKDWQLWGRSGNSFVKIAKINLPAGDGYTSQTVTFSSPVSFDALVVTPTVLGGYSWGMAMAITDVYTW